MMPIVQRQLVIKFFLQILISFKLNLREWRHDKFGQDHRLDVQAEKFLDRDLVYYIMSEVTSMSRATVSQPVIALTQTNCSALSALAHY